MDKSKYIKVTYTGKKPNVVLSSTRKFHSQQGAKIEEPTEAEIAEFFPEYQNAVSVSDLQGELLRLSSENEELKAENEKLKTEVTKLKAKQKDAVL